MRLVLASANKGKQREIAAICAPMGIEVVTAAELGFTEDIPETGDTFEANARLKAEAVSKALNLPALADDSGLVVDALDGAPGIHSARYAGSHGDDKANCEKLLSEMADVPKQKRGAAFVCVMICHRPDGAELVSDGRLEGNIAFKSAGESGFGYDPVFFLPDRGCTVAQIGADEKNAISHRGQAVRDLAGKLEEFIKV